MQAELTKVSYGRVIKSVFVQDVFTVFPTWLAILVVLSCALLPDRDV